MDSHEASDQWVSATEASRRVCCNPKQVAKLASEGFLTVRRLPGCDPRYLLADVVRLVSESTQCANASPIGVRQSDTQPIAS
jgi:hypothetical protein